MNYFNYYSEIEAAFIRRRGRNLLLSPVDWEQIESWKEKEIPLHIILRAIEDVFDAYDKKPTKRKIKSLSYCKDEIEAQHEEWLEAQIGKSKSDNGGDSFDVGSDSESASETFSADSVASHIERILSELDAAKSFFDGESLKSLEKVQKDLQNVEFAKFTAEKLENRLEELEMTVDETLLGSDKSVKLRRKLAKTMSEYKTKMDEEAFQRTFNLMLLKELREETGIPRFSLFYL